MFVYNLHDNCLENGANGRKCQPLLFTHATISFPKLPLSHLCSLMWHQKTYQLQLPLLLSLHPSHTSPGCVYLCVCVCTVCNASAAPWISVMSRGMEGQIHETLPCWHIGSVEHEFQLHRAEFRSSWAASQPSSRPETSSLQTSLTTPDAWTTHQHQLPPEMGNMVLRKVENWEVCQAVRPLVRAGEMEIVAQSCNTATGRQQRRKDLILPIINA